MTKIIVEVRTGNESFRYEEVVSSTLESDDRLAMLVAAGILFENQWCLGGGLEWTYSVESGATEGGWEI